ncbi:MAG: pilus assembly protein TadG-related protein [Actinomycetota bacterium]|nr:pilus assembly protein TadG-related protein [Actinomycetota bacterium]
MTASEERGAVLVFVALLLLAIFGMVALVVDAGAMLVKRRKVVAAADSASLAAAQSCAREQGDAASQANTYASGNTSDAALVAFTPVGCDSSASAGSVAVTYGANQELYFAPILGFDETMSVEASATAMWGPARSSEPIPLALNLNDPRACSASACNLWLDPSVAGGFTRGDAGVLNLSQWEGGSCSRSVSSSQLARWISGSDTEKVMLPATPCAVTRVDSSRLVGMLLGQVGRDKVFAVANGYSGGRFRVSGFTPLRIEGAVLAVGAVTDVSCGDDLVHSFPDRGATLDISGAVLACMLENSADSVSVRLDRGGSCCSQPRDYIFNPSTNVITWNSQRDGDDVRIGISWTRDAFTGDCGIQEVTGNEICLAVSWQGPSVGGTEPLESGASDYGVRAVRLEE